jgi:hypothetical protein
MNPVLKGHDFSRAEIANNIKGFSPCGMQFEKSGPNQGVYPQPV